MEEDMIKITDYFDVTTISEEDIKSIAIDLSKIIENKESPEKQLNFRGFSFILLYSLLLFIYYPLYSIYVDLCNYILPFFGH